MLCITVCGIGGGQGCSPYVKHSADCSTLSPGGLDASGGGVPGWMGRGGDRVSYDGELKELAISSKERGPKRDRLILSNSHF